MEENQLQMVFELYMNELLHELINEISGNSPFNFRSRKSKQDVNKED